MTCDDVRKAKGNYRSTTRAERAALVNHVRNCAECRRVVMGWLVAAQAATAQRAMERIADDRQDPEYRSVVG